MVEIRFAATVLAIASATLSGCGSAEKQDVPQVAAAKEAVQRLLTDPASAQFRDTRVLRTKSGAVSVCGEVNAKNRMGGYNGFQQFVYVPSDEGRAYIKAVPADTPPLLVTDEALQAETAFTRAYIDYCIWGTPVEEP